MFDVERLLGQMMSKGLGKATGGMGKGISSGLGSITGGIGGGMSKGALGVGALGVAWAAWEHFQEKNNQNQAQTAAVPPPLPPGAMPPAPQAYAPDQHYVGHAPAPSYMPTAMPVAVPAAVDSAIATREQDASHLISAMIAAANADGMIDAEERSQILERAMTANLNPQTQAFLLQELKAPKTVAQIVQQTRPGLQREVYAASMLAITNDTEAEQHYLTNLAQGLQLTENDQRQVQEMLKA